MLPLVPGVPMVPALPVVPMLPAPPLVPALPLVPAVPVGELSTQLPLTQCCPEPQACPQLPQFASLVVRATQAVPHTVCATQSVAHVPLRHTSVAWQMFVHVPQWFASDGTQEPLQSISPPWHWHWPLWQICPVEHGMPQPPQLFLSAVVFTHAEPQSVCPPAHTMPDPPEPVVPAVPVMPLGTEPAQLASVRSDASANARYRESCRLHSR